MNTGHEVDPPTNAAPTPESVLKAIAAGSGPWFPSTYAAQAGIPRDSLDDPLSVLRLAGLVRIDAWVRGVGQGYVLTPHGQSALADPALLKPRVPAETPSREIPFDPDPAKIDPTQRFQFREPILDFRPALVTPVLVGINLLWFFVGLVVAMRLGIGAAYLNGGGASTPALDRIGAATGPALMHGDWWRLATCCFVHVGWLHLLVNMVSLGVMGPVAEMMWGRRRLLVVYAVAGLAGSCLAMANRPITADGRVPTLAGASGAIWGVQMSLVAWVMLFRSSLPSHQVADWYRRFTIVLVINVGISLHPSISWEGHLGGGIAGFVTAGLLNARRDGSRRQRRLSLVLLLLLPVLCVGGLAAAMKYAAVWKPLRDRAAAVRVVERAIAFNRDVAPVLDELAPHNVHPVENEARLMLMRAPARRRKEDVAAIRQRVTDLHDRATFALSRLEGQATGAAGFDKLRDKATAFANMRAKSLEALRTMIDANAIPDEAAWAAWGATSRAADQLWAAMR